VPKIVTRGLLLSQALTRIDVEGVGFTGWRRQVDNEMMRILRLTDCASERDQSNIRRGILDIFFGSANKESLNRGSREEFQDRWTGYYFSLTPDWIFAAINDNTSQVLGYLMGTPDSRAAMPFYKHRLSSYALFEDLFEAFPAHLHMNTDAKFRGQGVGHALIERFVHELRQAEGNPAGGVHLVTSPDALNVTFYRREGFTHEVERTTTSGVPLLFMGRPLKQ
jgi:GNAT superfamily N-acetyltransferase